MWRVLGKDGTMNDEEKSKVQLIRELAELRQHVLEFKARERKLLREAKEALEESEEK